MLENEDKMKTRVKFKFLTGDVNWKDYGGKFISNKLNNGDWDYYMILNVINMHDATGEENQDKYIVELQAVSPAAAGEDNIKQVLSQFDKDDLERYLQIPDFVVGELATYGILAPLKTFSGNNITKLLQDAKRESQLAEMLFGFYMDGVKNRIGSTGWDCISGDILRPIREYQE
jgi:hypothetical protein